MIHRHLNNTTTLTLACIDDIIARGKRPDWIDLHQAALSDRTVLDKIIRVCMAHVADPYAQRYHFWKHYVEKQQSRLG